MGEDNFIKLVITKIQNAIIIADYQSHQRNRKLEKSKPGLIMFNTSAQQNESITINELHEHIQKSITESRNKLSNNCL